MNYQTKLNLLAIAGEVYRHAFIKTIKSKYCFSIIFVYLMCIFIGSCGSNGSHDGTVYYWVPLGISISGDQNFVASLGNVESEIRGESRNYWLPHEIFEFAGGNPTGYSHLFLYDRSNNNYLYYPLVSYGDYAQGITFPEAENIKNISISNDHTKLYVFSSDNILFVNLTNGIWKELNLSGSLAWNIRLMEYPSEVLLIDKNTAELLSLDLEEVNEEDLISTYSVIKYKKGINKGVGIIIDYEEDPFVIDLFFYDIDWNKLLLRIDLKIYNFYPGFLFSASSSGDLAAIRLDNRIIVLNSSGNLVGTYPWSVDDPNISFGFSRNEKYLIVIDNTGINQIELSSGQVKLGCPFPSSDYFLSDSSWDLFYLDNEPDKIFLISNSNSKWENIYSFDLSCFDGNELVVNSLLPNAKRLTTTNDMKKVLFSQEYGPPLSVYDMESGDITKLVWGEGLP